MKKIKNSNDKKGWYRGNQGDLFVHYGDSGDVSSVEFCYTSDGNEKVIRVGETSTVEMARIDDGEDKVMGHKSSPIYVPSGVESLSWVRERLASVLDELEGSEKNAIEDFINKAT